MFVMKYSNSSLCCLYFTASAMFSPVKMLFYTLQSSYSNRALTSLLSSFSTPLLSSYSLCPYSLTLLISHYFIFTSFSFIFYLLPTNFFCFFFVFFQALRREVRERTYSERVLHTPPVLSSSEQPCVLLPDRNLEYCRMLFLGCERDLLIFNILTYSMFDFWLNNTASAIFLCYLLDCAVSYYRRILGRVSGWISCLKLHFLCLLLVLNSL